MDKQTKFAIDNIIILCRIVQHKYTFSRSKTGTQEKQIKENHKQRGVGPQGGNLTNY